MHAAALLLAGLGLAALAQLLPERGEEPPAPCVIELGCAECLPDYMPMVTSHRAAGGELRAAHGDLLALACPGGRFLAYPLRDALSVRCDAGRYFVPLDAARHHLLDLGCQENIFEDVLHEVEECGPPLQGRAYQTREAGGGALHLATLCYDADRALAVRVVASGAPGNRLPLPPHAHRDAPLSLLGNFNHMFDASTRRDAERLFADDAALTRRLRELLRPERVSLAAQTLTSARLLAPAYFEEQNAGVTELASNRVAAWRSVAEGNLRHLQTDVARLLAQRNRTLEVYAGALGVGRIRTDAGTAELFLKPPRRFPVPRYLWTVVAEVESRRALALLVLNDPFVAVSEVREAVFCESACGRVSWLHELRRQRRFESPVLGLTFCCAVGAVRTHVPGMPRAALAAVPHTDDGLLLS